LSVFTSVDANAPGDDNEELEGIEEQDGNEARAAEDVELQWRNFSRKP
jgi:hypothetical protein